MNWLELCGVAFLAQTGGAVLIGAWCLLAAKRNPPEDD